MVNAFLNFDAVVAVVIFAVAVSVDVLHVKPNLVAAVFVAVVVVVANFNWELELD